MLDGRGDSMSFILHTIVLAIALVLTTRVVGGVHVETGFPLAIAALALGVINAFVRPVLSILTFPITLLTLGLFYLVVNGVCFALAAWLTPGFRLDSFGSAVLGALVLSVISWLIGLVVPSGKR
jgi:putative membrane protein